ncbi:type III secretion system HrpB7-like protein [Duganella sp. 1411]|uniref:hypothetical protein n=1 Tax=Duganella sp. 1411 TaxID=2806572 RepID=UPI001AE3BC85|nr:type III secretion system HrpB7-like protein [Duganella sp. 1411]
MRPAALRAWRTLRDVKTRAIERLERTLTARRAALEAAGAAARQRDAEAGACEAALAAHAGRLDALLAGGAPLTPRLYLEHDAWRARLAGELATAIAAQQAAQAIIADKRRELAQTRREIGAATARRDGIVERLAGAARAADAAQQDAQDDEAADTGLARLLARRAAEARAAAAEAEVENRRAA